MEPISPRRESAWYRIARFVLLLLLILAILLGILNIINVGFIDFPCFVTYDQVKNCIDKGSAAGRWEETTGQIRIESFLTTYVAGWSGGGCSKQSSAGNTLELHTSVGQLTLTREADNLKVNGKPIEKGEQFKKLYWWDWRPWIIARAEFTNEGVLADCNGNPEQSRLVVIGSYGTQTSLLKGALICLILVAGLVFVHSKHKKARST